MDIRKPVLEKNQFRTRLDAGVNRRAFVKLAISGAAAGAAGSPLMAFPKKSLAELPPGIKVLRCRFPPTPATKIYSLRSNSV